MLAIVVRIIGVVVLSFGTLVAQNNLVTIKNALASNAWPSVSGEILSSKTGPRSTSSSSSKAVWANVEYTYEVNGKKYTSTRISYNDYGDSNQKKIQKIADRYPQGARVDVFYNPDKPSSSILEFRKPIASYFNVAFGIVLCLVGFYFVIKPPGRISPAKLPASWFGTITKLSERGKPK